MSRVVVIKLSAAKDPSRWNVAEYTTALRAGLSHLLDVADPGAAVQSLLPKGVVGIKPNCVARDQNSTPVDLAEAVGNLLEKAGWKANEIIIWERTSRELRAAGYDLNASVIGRRCLGTDAHSGYAGDFHSVGEVSSLVSSILTELVVSNVNLPLLKDHSLAGLSGGLKNMYGAIHNPNKYHANNCDPFVAQVNALPPIKKTQRLTIMDAVRVQYDRGPGYSARHMANYGGLVISSDPVAADAVGLAILDRIRTDHGLPEVAASVRPARYLQSASELGLGVADLSQIEVVVRQIGSDGNVTDGDLF